MLFSSNYFGNIPYFQAIAAHDVIEIDLFEHYKKQSWRNRTQVLESNGLFYLTVPVERPNGNATQVKDVLILEKEDWRKDHWNAIQSSYSQAPYFFYYGAQLKELIYTEHKLLYQLNVAILKKILYWLDLSSKIKLSDSYTPPKDKNDYRILLDKKKYTLKQEKYIQVFADKFDFQANLSVIDLLMNLGPMSHPYIINKIY